MKYLTIIFLLISSIIWGQDEGILYLPETEIFNYPQVFIKTQIEAKVKVTFDVKGLIPQNVKAETLDSNKYEIIENMTIGNLDSLIFVRDVNNYSIVFEYVVSDKISNNYVEYLKPGFIRAVFRKPNTEINEYIKISSDCNEEDHTMTFTSFVYTHKPISTKSEIIVEIEDLDDESTVKINKNNLPQLKEEIMDAAKQAMKGFIKDSKNQCLFTPKKYYLKLKVVRLLGKENYPKLY